VPFEIPELLVIPGIADDRRDDGTLPPKTSSPISREKKARNRTLSSNQLCLGLYTTSRAAHMNSGRGSMGSALAVSAPGIILELGRSSHHCGLRTWVPGCSMLRYVWVFPVLPFASRLHILRGLTGTAPMHCHIFGTVRRDY
jgi:hypothetical protein